MTDHPQERARRLFDLARDLPADERASMLERECGSDKALRDLVLTMIAAAESDRSHGDTTTDIGPAADPPPMPQTAGATPREHAGQAIGRYKLLQPIGEGGFGTVWMADQKEPVKRRVALKIIKLGMDTRQVVARFEAERQALAMMDHPNIAKVLDAGATETGRPYFVMELVKGVPITEFCDTESLTTNERLELFIGVCKAAQHAHQKGIIHRDIKPSNVLVTLHDGVPVVKVIDFGIAKAIDRELTDKTLFTEFRQFIGTPQYMSPEQAEMSGLDIDTRSDIYALGVLLYELLTGVTPFDPAKLRSAALNEIQRIIREEEPPRPSTRLSTGSGEAQPMIATDERSSIQFITKHRRTDPRSLTRTLRGDLDWIVMKALEKDRARRYETANGFAMDIRRYLDNEPVTASPPSAAYRLRKLVRRNRGAVAAATAVFVALTLGVSAATYGLVRAVGAERVARDERDEARRQAEIAGAVNDFLNDDLLSAVKPSSRAGEGRDVMMREVLDQASLRIEEAGRPGGKFADKPSVEAQIHETLGLTYRELGDLDNAASHLRRALDLREREDEDPALLAGTLHNLGFLRVQQGSYAEAEEFYRRAIEIEVGEMGGDAAAVLESKSGLAVALREQDRIEEAEAIFLDVLERQRRTIGDEHFNTAVTMSNLANLYQTVGRYEESEALNRAILDTRLKQWGEDDPRTLSTLSNLANVVASDGRLAEAGELMRRVLEMKRRILGPEHPSTLNSMNNIGEVHAQLGDWSEAERWHRETLALRANVLGERHPRTITSMSVLAFALAMQGQYEDAREYAARSSEDFRDVLGADHLLTRESEYRLAICLLGLGRPEEAATILRTVAAYMESAGQEELLAESRTYLGIAEARLGHNQQAETLFREAVLSLPTWDAQTPLLLQQVIEILEDWDSAGRETARDALLEYREVLRRAGQVPIPDGATGPGG